jgi:hypothetical protein
MVGKAKNSFKLVVPLPKGVALGASPGKELHAKHAGSNPNFTVKNCILVFFF